MKRKYISILILLLTMGFASISTVLFIVGRTSVKRNFEDFDVYFSKAYLNGVTHDEYISSNGKNIDFGINELKTVGEEVVLEYEITNASSQYDADVSLLFDNLNNLNEYLEVTKEDNYDGFITSHGKGTGRITIKLIKPVTEESDVDMNLNLGINAEEKELEDMEEGYTPENPKPNSFSASMIVADEEENPLKDKQIVYKTANGLRYGETDLDGFIYQDNIPEGTMDLYVFDNLNKEEIMNMNEEDVKLNANRSITITTSTYGRQVGNKVILLDVLSKKTSEITLVEIKVDNKVLRKEVDEEKKVIFNIDTDSTVIEILSFGERTLTSEENIYEIQDNLGSIISVIVRNKKPTPPTLTGGNAEFVLDESVRVQIKEEGTATSGVSGYEYIISNSLVSDFTNINVVEKFKDEIIITDEGTHYIYLRTVSNNGTRSAWSNVEVVKIDKSSPVVEIKKTTTTSNSINIEFTATDIYSGIDRINCYYGDNYEYTGAIEGNVCSIKNLNSNKTYKYKICATDKVGNAETCKEGEAGTNEVKNPVITFENINGSTGDYYLSQTAKVNFNIEGIATPTHYIKSTRKGIASANVVASCGSGDTPAEECTPTTTNVIEKNIWYRVEGNINVTYNESYDEYSELVAITYDGLNYSRKATGTIGKIAFMAADLEYQNALAPDVRNVQEALDDLYKRFN